eukprot:6960765-Lingulodinium_polyedra.AAC.1
MAHIYDLQNDSCERRHARNKATFSRVTNMDYLVARGILQEAQSNAVVASPLPRPAIAEPVAQLQ